MMNHGPHAGWIALIAVGLAFPLEAGATTYEVTRAGQLDTLIGTPRLQGSACVGDRIHIHRGAPYVGPKGGWRITRPLEIYGDGPGDLFGGVASCSHENSTWLQPAGTSDPVLVIDISGFGKSGSAFLNLSIHDLWIAQNATGNPASVPADPNSQGVRYVGPQSEKGLVNTHFARVNVAWMGGDGFHLEGTNTGNGAIERVTFDDCQSDYNRGAGLLILNAIGPRVVGGRYRTNGRAGISLLSCNDPQLYNVLLEENQAEARGYSDAQLYLECPIGFSVVGCHFENFAGRSSLPRGSNQRRTAIGVTAGQGGYIGSNYIGNDFATSGSRGIYIWHGDDRDIVIGPNRWTATDSLIVVANLPTITSCVVMPQAISLSLGLAGLIVVPEDPDRGHLVMPATRPDSLGVTAGIALPRLTPKARDAMTSLPNGGTRREGLVIYNDGDKRLNHWDGKRWVRDAAFFPASSQANAEPAGLSLPAALTSTTRDQIPAEFKVKGALIFNTTTNKLNFWDGTSWKEISVQTGQAP